MPLYEYELVSDDPRKVERYEFLQTMSDPPLTRHPETGKPIRRVITAPRVPAKPGGPSSSGANLSDKNLERLGFTKYRKTGDGRYEKTAGSEGPSYINRQDGG